MQPRKRKFESTNRTGSDQSKSKRQRIALDFRGPHAGEYSEFFEYIKHLNIQDTDYYSLGQISKSKAKYFELTPGLVETAREFLSKFWESKDNVEETKLALQFTNKNEPQNPGSISFTEVEIDGKLYCFVTISSSAIKQRTHPELFYRLNNHVVHMNTQSKNKEYIFLNGHTGNFSCMLSLLNPKDYKNFRECSEKQFCTALVKLFMQYGNKMCVKSCGTFTFYPYEIDKNYGNEPDSSDVYVMPVGKNWKKYPIKLKNNLIIYEMGSCQMCYKNKAHTLLIMKAAQDFGKSKNEDKNRYDNEIYLCLTPLRDSIVNENCSLLETSVESGEKEMEKITVPDSQLVASKPLVLPRVNVKKLNMQYPLDVKDIHAILEARISNMLKMFPELAYKEIFVLGGTKLNGVEIDGEIMNTPANVLQRFLQKEAPHHLFLIVLLPIQLDNDHWIGLRLLIKEKYIQEIELMHSCCNDHFKHCKDIIKNLMQSFEENQLLEKFGVKKITSKRYIKPAGDVSSEDCPLYLIENFITSFTRKTIRSPNPQEWTKSCRIRHLQVLKAENPGYYDIYCHKQKEKSVVTELAKEAEVAEGQSIQLVQAQQHQQHQSVQQQIQIQPQQQLQNLQAQTHFQPGLFQVTINCSRTSSIERVVVDLSKNATNTKTKKFNK